MRTPFDPKTYFNKPRVLLAPMAGYTDRVFRSLCFREGCEGACSEMVSAKGLCFESRRTEDLLAAAEGEYPRGIQLFGSDPYYMGEAVKRLGDPEERQYDFIDINCGCPARKIVSNGDGSALMGNVPLAFRVIAAVAEASPVPVSVKFRAGIDETRLNFAGFAKAAEEAGAAFLTVHGRTAAQQYMGTADWEKVRLVKEAAHIPVIGNGDVTGGETALEKLALSHADGVMVGRGALGNPFVFREIRAALEGRPSVPPTVAERAETALEQLEKTAAWRGERSVIELRKHLPLYFNGLKGSSGYRTKLSGLRTVEEIRALLLDIRENGIYNI